MKKSLLILFALYSYSLFGNIGVIENSTPLYVQGTFPASKKSIFDFVNKTGVTSQEILFSSLSHSCNNFDFLNYKNYKTEIFLELTTPGDYATNGNVFDYTIPLKIELWEPGVISTTPSKTILTSLSLKYSKALESNNNNYYTNLLFEGYTKVRITQNTSASPTISISQLLTSKVDMKLNAKITAEESYKIEYIGIAHNSTNIKVLDNNYDGTQKNVATVSFKNVFITSGLPYSCIGDAELIKPDEYDFEWAFVPRASIIGDELAANIYSGLLDKLTYSRVTIKSKQYDIPLIYPEGFILYRIRPVTYVYGNRVEGIWNNFYNNNIAISSSIAHEKNLNWVSTINFAEEGKRKEIVSYFDGTQRERQSVTINTSNNIALVSETFYDFMGRKAITTMPAPVLNDVLYGNLNLQYSVSVPKSSIGFNRNFNKDEQNINYNTSNFDKPSSNFCLPVFSDPFNINFGTSKYYSNKNFLHFNTNIDPKLKYLNLWVPDAGKYPFTQTIYTNDGTNRIRFQSGVGVDHKIASGHETKYSYTNVNSPEELDRLFGTNVGDKQYYSKTYTEDANGQMSVSYQNMSGKTIATALIGNKPGDLEALPSYTASTLPLTYTFVNQSSMIKDYQTMSLQGASTHQVPISTQNLNFTINLNHTLTTDDYLSDLCKKDLPLSYCADCYYDVSVKMTDECGVVDFQEDFSNAPSNALPVDLSCNNPAPSVTKNFTKSLNKGVHNISAVLKVNENFADEYTRKYIDQFAKCDENTLEALIAKNTSAIDPFDCISTCTECNAMYDKGKANYRNRIYNNFKDLESKMTSVDFNNLIDKITDEQYVALKMKCDKMCDSKQNLECEVYLSQLKSDVSREGQYGFFYNKNIPVPAYVPQDVSVLYYVINNSKFKKVDGTLINTIQEAINFWNEGWVDELVKYHPEYCFYERCLQKAALNYNFDKTFEAANVFKCKSTASESELLILPADKAEFGQSYMDMYNNFTFFYTSNLFPAGIGAPNQISIPQWAYILAFGQRNSQNIHKINSLDPYTLGAFNADPCLSSLCEADKALYWKFYKSTFKILRDYFKYKNLKNVQGTTCIDNGYIGCGRTIPNNNSNSSYENLNAHADIFKDVLDPPSPSPCPNQATTILNWNGYTKVGAAFNNKVKVFPDFEGSAKKLISNLVNAASNSTDANNIGIDEKNNSKLKQCQYQSTGWIESINNCVVNNISIPSGKTVLDLKNELKANFVKICTVYNGEEPYLFGTKSLPSTHSGLQVTVNGNSYSGIKSFQEILNLYPKKAGVQTPDADCISDWITSLPEYGTGPMNFRDNDQVVVMAPKKESCECDQINMWKDKYEKDKYSGTFLAYLKSKDNGFDLTQSQLDLLVEGCKNNDVYCRYAGMSFLMPNIFKCKKNYNCFEYSFNKELFNTKYQNYNWSTKPTSYKEDVFTAFMNSKKGMNLEYDDYKNFELLCSSCVPIDFGKNRAYIQTKYNQFIALNPTFPRFNNNNLQELFNALNLTNNEFETLLEAGATPNPKNLHRILCKYMIETKIPCCIKEYYDRFVAENPGIGNLSDMARNNLMKTKINNYQNKFKLSAEDYVIILSNCDGVISGNLFNCRELNTKYKEFLQTKNISLTAKPSSLTATQKSDMVQHLNVNLGTNKNYADYEKMISDCEGSNEGGPSPSPDPNCEFYKSKFVNIDFVNFKTFILPSYSFNFPPNIISTSQKITFLENCGLISKCFVANLIFEKYKEYSNKNSSFEIDWNGGASNAGLFTFIEWETGITVDLISFKNYINFATINGKCNETNKLHCDLVKKYYKLFKQKNGDIPGSSSLENFVFYMNTQLQVKLSLQEWISKIKGCGEDISILNCDQVQEAVFNLIVKTDGFNIANVKSKITIKEVDFLNSIFGTKYSNEDWIYLMNNCDLNSCTMYKNLYEFFKANFGEPGKTSTSTFTAFVDFMNSKTGVSGYTLKTWVEQLDACGTDIKNYLIDCEQIKEALFQLMMENESVTLSNMNTILVDNMVNKLNAASGSSYLKEDWVQLFTLCNYEDCRFFTVMMNRWNNNIITKVDEHECKLEQIVDKYNEFFNSNKCVEEILENLSKPDCHFDFIFNTNFAGNTPNQEKLTCFNIIKRYYDFINITDYTKYLDKNKNFDKTQYLLDMRVYLNDWFDVNLSLCDYNYYVNICNGCCSRDLFYTLDINYLLYMGGVAAPSPFIGNNNISLATICDISNINPYRNYFTNYQNNYNNCFQFYCTKNISNSSYNPHIITKEYNHFINDVGGDYLDKLIQIYEYMGPIYNMNYTGISRTLIDENGNAYSGTSLIPFTLYKELQNKKDKCIWDCSLSPVNDTKDYIDDIISSGGNNSGCKGNCTILPWFPCCTFDKDKLKAAYQKAIDEIQKNESPKREDGAEEWFDFIYWDMVASLDIETTTKEELRKMLLCCGIVDAYYTNVDCEKLKKAIDEILNDPTIGDDPIKIVAALNSKFGINATFDYWQTKMNAEPCAIISGTNFPKSSETCERFKGYMDEAEKMSGGKEKFNVMEYVFYALSKAVKKYDVIQMLFECYSCEELERLLSNTNSSVYREMYTYYTRKYNGNSYSDFIKWIKSQKTGCEGFMNDFKVRNIPTDTRGYIESPFFEEHYATESQKWIQSIKASAQNSPRLLVFANQNVDKNIQKALFAFPKKPVFASDKLIRNTYKFKVYPTGAKETVSNSKGILLTSRSSELQKNMIAFLTEPTAIMALLPLPPAPNNEGVITINPFIEQVLLGAGANASAYYSFIDPNKYKCCGICDYRMYDKVYTPSTPVEISPCEYRYNLAITKAMNDREELLKEKAKEYKAKYIQKCLDAARLEVKGTGDDQQHHYTLYYYDVNGNLVQTVSPEGVNLFNTTVQLDAVKAARLAGTQYLPAHTLNTTYQYNMAGQVIKQKSPDAGETIFIYDELGRLIISQNAKQAPTKFSYSLYDKLNRIKESGEIESYSGILAAANYNYDEGGTNPHRIKYCNYEKFLRDYATFFKYRYVMRTYYDQTPTAPNVVPSTGVVLENISKRIAATTLDEWDIDKSESTFKSAMYYSYDMMGNVKKLYSYHNDNNLKNSKLTTVDYEYDLQSGKVNKVYYQKGAWDQFIHKYDYDAENRLIKVATSFDDYLYNTEATYNYYLHGPLARTELGDKKIQGLDYVYTIQGWLKSINGSVRDQNNEPGRDGQFSVPIGTYPTIPSPPSTKNVATDAVSMSLDYFQGDYKPISSVTSNIYSKISPRNLYNGNIVSMYVDNRALVNTTQTQTAGMYYSYKYDQLNRMVGMDAYKPSAAVPIPAPTQFAAVNDFKETVSYDANGNIKTYFRNGNNATSATVSNMDNMTYTYKAGKNQLDMVADAVGATSVGVNDLKAGQTAGNYVYDAIGNLVEDKQAGLLIEWTPTGKISKINDLNKNQILTFVYDPMGNRIQKTVTTMLSTGATRKHTYYKRDAQGNVLATYTKMGDALDDTGPTISLSEWIVYGSSRLGVKNPNMLWTPQTITNGTTLTIGNRAALAAGVNFVRENIKLSTGIPLAVRTSVLSGMTEYEATNHLGNVLATLKDEPLLSWVNTGVANELLKSPIILTATDYYPFGMPMPKRTYPMPVCSTAMVDVPVYVIKDDFGVPTQDWTALTTAGLGTALNINGGMLEVYTPLITRTIERKYYLVPNTNYQLSFVLNAGTCGILSTTGRHIKIVVRDDNTNNEIFSQLVTATPVVPISFTTSGATTYKIYFELVDAMGAGATCYYDLDDIKLQKQELALRFDVAPLGAGWIPINSTLAVAANPLNSNNFALQINKIGTATSFGATYTVSNLIPTVKYTLKIKGFKPGICNNPTVNIVCGTCANNSTTIMTTPQTLSNNTISFTNPVGNTAIKIVVQYPTTVAAACNILYVDDVELIKEEILDHFTPGGSWSATYGWTGSNTLTSPAVVSNALRVTNNTAQEGFKRNITLAAKKYTFSFFMDKGLEDLNDKEYFSVDIINSSNAIVYTYTTKVNATGYYNFDYSATTAGTYTWRFRRVSLNGRSTSGTAYFDDFKVSSTIQQSQQVCSSPKNYRFGFNTQEKDDEVYGAGNLNTAMFWEYDTRLGRRWNTDPVVKVSLSSYSVMSNNPILRCDPNGDNDYILLQDGHIVVEETNEPHRLYATDIKNRKMGKDYSIALSKDESDFLDKRKVLEISKNVKWTTFQIDNNYSLAKRLYNFITDYCTVEFSLIVIKENGESINKNGDLVSNNIVTYLTTSHNNEKEANGSNLIENTIINDKFNSYTFLRHEHNHPRSREENELKDINHKQGSPSKKDGDCGVYESIKKHSGNCDFKIRENGEDYKVDEGDCF